MFWLNDTIMIFTPRMVILWSECKNTAEISDKEFSRQLVGILKLIAIRFLIQHKKAAVICHCQRNVGSMVDTIKVTSNYKGLDLLSL